MDFQSVMVLIDLVLGAIALLLYIVLGIRSL